MRIGIALLLLITLLSGMVISCGNTEMITETEETSVAENTETSETQPETSLVPVEKILYLGIA